jgi:hypothetical protein
MELVLVITFAGLIGGALRYMIPGRDRHGLGLMPSVAIMVASLAFVASVWLGLAPRSVWPWVISLGLATAAVVWLGVWLPKKRDADDERLFAELTEPASS